MLTEQAEFDSPPPRRALWPWVVVAAAVVVVLGYSANRPPGRGLDATKHPAVGKRLEKVQLQPLTGGGDPVAASELQGRVTLINFWGPWCPPCRIEFPHMQELEQHFRAREGFRFLSVSCSGGEGEETDMEESTAEFLAQQEAEFPTYRDAFAATRIDLQEAIQSPMVYPTTVVLDRQGAIRGVWLGYTNGDEMQMRAVIEKALSEPEQPLP